MSQKPKGTARSQSGARGEKGGANASTRGTGRTLAAARTVAESAPRAGYSTLHARKPSPGKRSGGTARPRKGPGQATRSAVRQAFLERAVDYIAEVADTAPETVIIGALREPTALATIAHALTESVVEERELDEADRQIAAALAAGAQYKADLLDRAGGAFSAEQLGNVLAISRQAVNAGRKTNLYFGVPSGQSFAYPKVQVSGDGVLNGLRSFLDAFTLPDPWMKLAVLVEPSERLDGRSPLDALRAGDVNQAVLVAETYGGHGA
jgi:hypothetical protein